MATNFWTDSATTVGELTSDRRASVMTREADGGISEGTFEIAVKDPTMENAGTIGIEIDRLASSPRSGS